MSFSVSTCLSHTGLRPLGPTIYVYSDVDSYGLVIDTVLTSDITGENCPYILLVPDNTTNVKLFDPISKCFCVIPISNCDFDGYAYDVSEIICDIDGYAYDVSEIICDIDGYVYDVSEIICDIDGYVYDVSEITPTPTNTMTPSPTPTPTSSSQVETTNTPTPTPTPTNTPTQITVYSCTVTGDVVDGTTMDFKISINSVEYSLGDLWKQSTYTQLENALNALTVGGQQLGQFTVAGEPYDNAIGRITVVGTNSYDYIVLDYGTPLNVPFVCT